MRRSLSPPFRRCATLVALAVAASSVSIAQTPSTVLGALEVELARAMKTLTEKADPPPYFIGYAVFETDETRIEASLGALRSSRRDRERTLDVDVRVGDYRFDNTRQLRGERDFMSFASRRPVQLALDDDLDAIRSHVYLETDRRYRAAAERMITVRANSAVKVAAEDSSADFSREIPHRTVLPTVALDVDRAAWEARAKRLSARFAKYPDLLSGSVRFQSEATNKFLVTSEGTALQHGLTHVRLMIGASTRADDGMELWRYEIFDAHTVAGLPDDGVVERAIDSVVKDLLALRSAPTIEPYTGPAILTGRAAGVFFHEIFGHRIEGHRQKDEEEGQTFTKMIGRSVLPEFLSVYDDPTRKSLEGIDLNGYYLYDDEGTKAERVTVIDKGVLKTFLMSRSPVAGFDRSNGHGRKEPGRAAVGRQGNLIVEASKSVSEAKLKQMLIEECKRQNKPFGLLFKDISGGFTFTGRGIPQAFAVEPIMVYRVYLDGREELVRGADLIGTPLTSFSKIIAAGDRREVFNGVCGAESGWVPVSGVAPSLLTTQIEIQKKEKSADRPPLLPAPSKDNPQ